MNNLEVSVTDRGEFAVVAVVGEMDLASAPRLRERLVDLSDEGRRSIVIDLTRLDFVDSTGLGVLVGGLRRSRDMSGDLVLAGPPPGVLKMLAITGLGKVFTVCPDVDSAV